MKIDDLEQSKRIEDRRGQQQSGYSSGSSNGLGILLQLLMSSGRGKWLVILVLLLAFLGGGMNLGDLFGASQYQSSYSTSQSASTAASDQDAVFVSKVFNSTEEFWTQEFARNGKSYQPPTMVLYSEQTQTNGCGVGSAQAGPFYCPADEKVYIDLSFYQELTSKYNAAGDFAMAYVIAHEVGHHVQNQLGTMESYTRARQGKSEKVANALNVRLELQADYYAGVWANHVENEGLLEIGDVDEALAAAHAVGDDTLQEAAYGTSVPDSFTHGSSAQRQKWFKRGYQYGDIEHGDTFSASIN
ncbi:KPN_02809 family neutral zinc metallopeptidase [Streptococcus sp. 20-1249]|uniref:KPN_02809 family neutral zinc metallopeptidase n=1 Tax=Streptococcus hepaticus TaxID=3349163 RepID=UPI00374A4D36